MKKFIVPLLLTFSFCFISTQSSSKVGVAQAFDLYVQKNAVKVPTEIDLNDVEDEKIREYYAGLDSKSESELQGTNLLKNLKTVLKEGHTPYAYGASGTTQVWQAYEIIDRDWTKSPASEIEGYNPSTNKIIGYVYGSSVEKDRGSDPYVHALYVNRDKDNGTKAWSDHSQKNYGINQEHVWPKSLGFETQTSNVGARGDMMHLMAGNGYVNKLHSNYYYGNVDSSTLIEDAGTTYSYLSGNKLGYSKRLGGSVKVFEPQDSDKGDIARAVFYMMARYSYLEATGETIDSSNPNLAIVNDVTSWQDEGYPSTQSETGKIGILQDLLEWNKLDPVDSFEIHRNNLLYRNFSHNRNPFIDFPQWADYIWGTSEDLNHPTGSAKPSSDVIAKGNDAPVYPKDDSKKLDIKTIAIIAGVAVVALIIVIVIFSKLSKKNKRKVLKTTKKFVKKQTKSSKKKK